MQLRDYFKTAIDHKASDLHLIGNTPPALRVAGKLETISGEEPLDQKALESEIKTLVGESAWQKFNDTKELDFSHEFFGQRFRINLHYQRGTIGVSARLISGLSPDPRQLGFT